jgi:uncharacterized protein YlxP (DUF503 family)
MYVGTLTCDLLLGDVRSLKQKRSAVRPVIAELKRAFDVSAAETGHLELHRRAEVAVAVVAADAAHCHRVLSACEALVAARPELELLAVRSRVWDDEDE